MSTKEQMELEEKQLEIEERKVDLENKRLVNAALREDQELKQMEKENKRREHKSRGESLRTQRPEVQHAVIRQTCNHHQGGFGREHFLQGRGSLQEDSCVTKIKLPTGDVMIRCPRCRKTWLPPWEANFHFDAAGNWKPKEEGGKFDKEKYQAALDEYNEAYNFTTKSATVLTPQYRWARGDKPINREVTYRFVKNDVRSPATAYYDAKMAAAKVK